MMGMLQRIKSYLSSAGIFDSTKLVVQSMLMGCRALVILSAINTLGEDNLILVNAYSWGKGVELIHWYW